MKSIILSSLCLTAVTLTAFPSISQAAPAACAAEKSSAISRKCRAELARTMGQDRVTSALRAELERSYPLTACGKIDAKEIKVQYRADEAVGAVLEVSSFIGCTSDEGVDGYTIGGEYFIDGGGYGFKSITLSTFE
jgi:hypothetical protein